MRSRIKTPLLTESETAYLLNLKRQTLAVRRCKGKPLLPFVRVGRSIRYQPSDVDSLLEVSKEGGEQ